MTGLIPFNRRNSNLTHTGAGFEDFYNVLDDFFNDGAVSGRNLLRDSFKIDIEEKDNEYLIEAELPGVQKDEVDLSIEHETLFITVNRTEENTKEGRNYIHRERRASSMCRRVRLTGVRTDEIKAKLEDGVLSITIPKVVKADGSRKIDIG